MGVDTGSEEPLGDGTRPKSRLSTRKLILILGGLVVCGFLFWGGLSAAWVYFYGRKFMDDTRAVLEEGRAAGLALDASACVDIAVERMESCAGYELKCRFKQQFFLQGCLNSSQLSPEFCSEVPKTSDILDSVSFRRRECTKRKQGGKQGCEQLMQAVQMFCDSRKTEPRAP